MNAKKGRDFRDFNILLLTVQSTLFNLNTNFGDSRSKTQPKKQQIGFSRKIGNCKYFLIFQIKIIFVAKFLSTNSKGQFGNKYSILSKVNKNEVNDGSTSEPPCN